MWVVSFYIAGIFVTNAWDNGLPPDYLARRFESLLECQQYAVTVIADREIEYACYAYEDEDSLRALGRR